MSTSIVQRHKRIAVFDLYQSQVATVASAIGFFKNYLGFQRTTAIPRTLAIGEVNNRRGNVSVEPSWPSVGGKRREDLLKDVILPARRPVTQDSQEAHKAPTVNHSLGIEEETHFSRPSSYAGLGIRDLDSTAVIVEYSALQADQVDVAMQGKHILTGSPQLAMEQDLGDKNEVDLVYRSQSDFLPALVSPEPRPL